MDSGNFVFTEAQDWALLKGFKRLSGPSPGPVKSLNGFHQIKDDGLCRQDCGKGVGQGLGSQVWPQKGILGIIRSSVRCDKRPCEAVLYPYGALV